jgi:hypothetical protein
MCAQLSPPITQLWWTMITKTYQNEVKKMNVNAKTSLFGNSVSEKRFWLRKWRKTLENDSKDQHQLWVIRDQEGACFAMLCNAMQCSALHQVSLFWNARRIFFKIWGFVIFDKELSFTKAELERGWVGGGSPALNLLPFELFYIWNINPLISPYGGLVEL